MGTETFQNGTQQRHHHERQLVKLNNPLMGTETENDTSHYRYRCWGVLN